MLGTYELAAQERARTRVCHPQEGVPEWAVMSEAARPLWSATGCPPPGRHLRPEGGFGATYLS